MKERVFKRDNVVKRTGSEYQAENYLAAGYEEITETYPIEDKKEEPKTLDKLKAEELKALLVEKGVDFDAKATKAELLALLQG